MLQGVFAKMYRLGCFSRILEKRTFIKYFFHTNFLLFLKYSLHCDTWLVEVGGHHLKLLTLLMIYLLIMLVAVSGRSWRVYGSLVPVRLLLLRHNSLLLLQDVSDSDLVSCRLHPSMMMMMKTDQLDRSRSHSTRCRSGPPLLPPPRHRLRHLVTDWMKMLSSPHLMSRTMDYAVEPLKSWETPNILLFKVKWQHSQSLLVEITFLPCMGHQMRNSLICLFWSCMQTMRCCIWDM